MVTSLSRFQDTQTHWARPFIEGLAQRNIVRGFEDGTFRPERAMSRAEFAAVLQSAFSPPGKRPYVPFVDVPANHWAAAAIRRAYESGFLSGYPGQQFRPTETISRVQAIASLVGGVGLTTSEIVPLAQLYQDSTQVPVWATGAIASATANSIVVNYPDVRRLRPTQPATRAEICAFIYQCLVSLEKVPAIASTAIVQWVPPVVTLAMSHRREFRAAWVATVWNGDWPSKPGLSVQQQQAELLAILDQMQATNLNALILQVRPEGDALYASSLEPWSNWLTGIQGKAPEPFYDPLEFAIAQAHQRNIELHAWFNPYRARTSERTVNVRPHLTVTNPDVVYGWDKQLWMDPGATVVQDRTYNVILDVVRRYDVDGIHLDDYFYPYPIAGQTFPDDKTYQGYQAGGGTLALADWRRDNVNRLIQRLATGIRAAKPHVKFGISPFGIYRPGQPPQIQGLDAYNQLYADSLKWLQEGWVDYLSPQLYWRSDAIAQSYPVLLRWWTENNPKQRHLYPGNNLGALSSNQWDLAEILHQIELTRQLMPQLALGNVFFSTRSLAANYQSVSDRFRTETYADLALPPSMSWLEVALPVLPTGVRASNGKLAWNASTTAIRGWSLYQKQGDTWKLSQLLPLATTTVTVVPGTYALCTLNRVLVESKGVVVTVG